MDIELVPLFAEFGFCVFVAQNLERDIETLLAAVGASSKDIPSNYALEEIFSDKNPNGLGSLFNELRKKEYITKIEEKSFYLAIRNRNHLVHSFITKNVLKTQNAKGREELIAEIFSIRDSLEAAQYIARNLLDKYLKDYNLSTDLITEIARKSFSFDYDKLQ